MTESVASAAPVFLLHVICRHGRPNNRALQRPKQECAIMQIVVCVCAAYLLGSLPHCHFGHKLWAAWGPGGTARSFHFMQVYVDMGSSGLRSNSGKVVTGRCG